MLSCEELSLCSRLRAQGVEYGTDDGLPPPAWLSESVSGGVRCLACENQCLVRPGKAGKCGVRVLLGGSLRCLAHSRALAAYDNPSEMKPLFHFLPSQQQLSIGFVGCNASCVWCQNHHMSVVEELPPSALSRSHLLQPPDVAAECQRRGVPAASFTFNEPTCTLEWCLEASAICRRAGILTTFVTNGFQALGGAIEGLVAGADGVNVDLKSGDEAALRNYCGLRGSVVRRNIETLVRSGVWVEVTTLLVGGVSDSEDGLRSIAGFLVGLSADIPWHVTAFHPDHHMRDRPRTSSRTLMMARQIGTEAGLRYVYTGNDPRGYENTHCPSCGETLVERAHGRGKVRQRWKQLGECHVCGTRIPGVWSAAVRVTPQIRMN